MSGWPDCMPSARNTAISLGGSPLTKREKLAKSYWHYIGLLLWSEFTMAFLKQKIKGWSNDVRLWLKVCFGHLCLLLPTRPSPTRHGREKEEMERGRVFCSLRLSGFLYSIHCSETLAYDFVWLRWHVSTPSSSWWDDASGGDRHIHPDFTSSMTLPCSVFDLGTYRFERFV